MKKILLILLAMTLFVACNDNENNETNGKYDPSFTLTELGSVGYLKDGKMEVEFYISDVEGDQPYHFEWLFGDEEEGAEPLVTNELEMKHEYKKQGRYKCVVKLVDNDKEEYSEERNIVVKTKVDLTIQSFDTSELIVDPEGNGKFSINISNLGEKAKEPFSVKLYFSDNDTFSNNDIAVGEVKVDSLSGGGVYSGEISYKAPKTPGLYWVFLKVDADNNYLEGDESNNVKQFSTKIEVVGGTSNSPDLVVDSITLPEFILKDGYFNILFNAKNNGRKTAAPFSYKIIVSPDDKLDKEDDEIKNDKVLKFDYVASAILSGESEDVSVDRLMVEEEGDFYFFVVLDPLNDIKESDEKNNFLMSEKREIGLTLDGVDIFPSNISISPRDIKKGRTLTLSYIVKNRGSRPALGTNVRAFISRNKILDDDDVLLTFENSEEGSLDTIGPDSFIEKTHRVIVPDNDSIQLGDYYIIIDVNYEVESNRVEEADYSNNAQYSSKFEITESAACTKDIAITNFTVLPNPAFEGSPYSITFDLGNPGIEEVTSFVTRIYAAPFGTEIKKEHLKRNYNTARLAPGMEYHRSITFELPSHMTTNKYCVLLKADATGIIGECDEENNIQQTCFDVVQRGNDNDLTVTNVTANTDTIEAGKRLKIGFEVSNLGTTNSATFYCNAYFSPDNEFSEDDFKVDQKQIVYNVLGGESVQISNYEILVPKNMGDRKYQLMVYCDSTKLVPETNEENNVGAFSSVTVTNSTSGCNADNFELNETSEQASIILPETMSAILCDQDVDWYKFETINATHKFRITMDQENMNNDIDLVLYKMVNNELVEIDNSSLEEGLESLEKNILTPEDTGEYYVKVYPKNNLNFEETNYTLMISYEEVGGPGIDLVLRDVQTNAANIKTNDTFNIKFTVENLRDLSSGNYRVDVYLSEDSVGDPQDTLLLSNIYPSLGLIETKNFDLNLRLNDELEPGEYNLIVVVDPVNDINEINEENNSFTKPILVNYVSLCEMDSLEPNSWDPFSGKVVGNGTYTNLKVCKKKKDAYLLYLTKDDEVTIDLSFVHREGDIDIYLYKPDGTTEVAKSNSSNNVENITHTATETGYYKLQVKRSFSGSNPNSEYTMVISGVTSGYNLTNNSLEITSSYLETNEDFTFKYNIESKSNLNLTQPVKYTLYLSEDPIIDQEDTIIYEKIFPRMNIGQKIKETAKGTLPANINTASYYFLSKIDSENAVEEFDENDNKRHLRKAVVGLCREDVYEVNNSIELAEEHALITQGRTDNLTLCPNDVDFYAISLQAGEKIFVNTYFRNILGDIDIRLLDRDGETRLAQSNSSTDNEFFSYTIENGGIYYIRARAPIGTIISNTYDLEVLIPNCTDLDCGDGGVCAIDDFGALYCECNDGYLSDTIDKKICHPDPCLVQDVCGANMNCSVTDNFTANCECDDLSHDENGTCVLNIRKHTCENDKVDNSDWKNEFENGELTQTWNNETKIWEPANDTECLWSCSEGFLHNEARASCIANPCLVQDACGPNMDCTPDNNFIAVCSCNNESHIDPNDDTVCILNTKSHTCENDKVENSDWKDAFLNGEFTQTWNNETQIWEPADNTLCLWSCMVGYDRVNDTCVPED